MFDPFVSRRETTFELTRDTVRQVGHESLGHAWAFRLGETITTLRPHLWVNLERDIAVRAGDKTVAFELSKYRYLAGLRLFGLELGGGVGLVPLSVDISHGKWSVGGLSPSGIARIGFKVGMLRLSLDAFQQYHFRWTGRDSVWVRGIGGQLALERPRTFKRRNHPLELDYR